MKKTLRFFIITFLLCALIYICKIDSIPDSIIVYEKESINFGDFFGLTYKIGNSNLNTILTTSNLVNDVESNNIVKVKLFDRINLKDVNVSVIDKTTVIPVGQVSGLKLYTNGVMVVGMGEIKAEDGRNYKPYENCNIQEGDRIIKINNEEVLNTNHLIEIVNKSQGKTLNIEFIKKGEAYLTEITPIKSKDKTYKIGLWVRDSNAGIGTLSIYEPSTGNFAALGHGITDIDTGDLVEISDGEFLTTNIVSIEKGQKGNPRKNKRDNRKSVKKLEKYIKTQMLEYMEL